MGKGSDGGAALEASEARLDSDGARRKAVGVYLPPSTLMLLSDVLDWKPDSRPTEDEPIGGCGGR
jgi:hypothetical protein